MRLTGSVLNRGGGKTSPQQLSVLAVVAFLDLIAVQASGTHLLERLAVARHIVRVRQCAQRHVESLPLTVTEHLLHGRIGAQYSSFLVEHRYANPSIVKDGAKRLFTLAQPYRGRLQLRRSFCHALLELVI